MDTPHPDRTLRVLLGALALADAAFGVLFFADPGVTAGLYDAIITEPITAFFGTGRGLALLLLALAGLLGAVHPRQRSLLLFIIIGHFGFFLTDVIAVAREQVRLLLLLPEMGYFLLIAIVFIRLYPSRERETEPAVETPITTDLLSTTNEDANGVIDERSEEREE